MAQSVSEQARQLHRAVHTLVKRYQFRERNDVCCYGISVSQCYALEALSEYGTLTMQALADHVHLAVSSVTRMIDHLVEKQLVARHHSARDRRVCCVSLTTTGVQLLETIQADLIAREQMILERIPEASRAHVVWAMGALAEAIEDVRQTWQQETTAKREGD